MTVSVPGIATAAIGVGDTVLGIKAGSLKRFTTDYIQAGAGATSRTVQSKMREPISVKDFGAVGDGATNDTAAVQAAVTAVIAAGGGTAFFPNGKYLLSTTVTIAGSHVRLSGNAWIVNGQTNAPAISFGDGATRYYGGGVDDLQFMGKTAVVGVAGQKGLYCTKMAQMSFNGVRANAGTGAALFNGVYFSDINQFFASDLEVQDCLDTGVTFLGCEGGEIIGSRSDANASSGWLLNGCAGMQLDQCTAYNNTVNAFRLVSTNPAVAQNSNCWFSGCVGDTSGSFNWTITDCRNSQFMGCWGSTQQSTVVNTSSTGFYIATSYCLGLSFVGGIAVNNNSHGVAIDAAVSAPVNISFTNFIFGTTGAGNGKSGAGYGLQVSGTGITRVHGGSFTANTDGAVSVANPAQADIVIDGRPVGHYNVGRTQCAQGTSTASANNLVLPYDGTYIPISAATQINLIDATGWYGGDVVTLKFASTPTVKHNQATAGANKKIMLAGAADFVASANDTLTLRYDAVDAIWYEQSRAVI